MVLGIQGGKGSVADRDWFTTTHWSVVLQATHSRTPQADAALEQLCGTYWYPLYAFVRHRGYDRQDAQELTQAFFARFIAQDYLKHVDRAKGRFRSFLLASLKHFLANEWDRAHAQKRGGYTQVMSLNDAEAERRYGEEAATDLSPDQLYEQRWAGVLLERVLERLEQEFEKSGKSEWFKALKPFLVGESRSITYAAVAERLGVSAGALKMKAQRLRYRYQGLLRQEIAQTVAGPEEVEDEIRYLFRVLSG